MAEVLVQTRPLSLLVEIDELRTRLGGWRTSAESRLIARDLAISLIEAHLAKGLDVVVPQYVGRTEFIDRLESTAQSAGAEFVEVLLDLDRSVATARFTARRRSTGGRPHPEADVADEDIHETIEDAADALREVLRLHASVRVLHVSATWSVEDTVDALLGLGIGWQ